MPKILIDGSWRFNKNVSINFDEHVKQSIPKYSFLQKNIARMCEYFIKKNCIVYDVGCSTGFVLEEAHERGWRALGLDALMYEVGPAMIFGLGFYFFVIKPLQRIPVKST